MRACFAQLTQHGKPAQVAPVAFMRKLLIVANAVLRNGVPWHPQENAVA